MPRPDDALGGGPEVEFSDFSDFEYQNLGGLPENRARVPMRDDFGDTEAMLKAHAQGMERFKTNDPQLQRWLLALMQDQQKVYEIQMQHHARMLEVVDNRLIEVLGHLRNAPHLHPSHHEISHHMAVVHTMDHDHAAGGQSTAVNHSPEKGMDAKAAPRPAPRPAEDGDVSLLVPCAEPDPAPEDVAPSQSDGQGRRGRKTASEKALKLRGATKIAVEAVSHPWATMVRHEKELDVVVSVLIIISTVCMLVKMQWEGYKCEIAMGLAQPDSGRWPHAEEIFNIIEHFFATFFLIELMLRVYLHGVWKQISSVINFVDAFVVLVIAVDIFIFSRIWADGGNNQRSVVLIGRMVRVVKLTRTMRMVRTMNACHELRVVTRTISASLGSLFWSMIILGFIVLMNAIILCEAIQPMIQEGSFEESTRKWLFVNYGNAVKASWTLFKITFSGGWPTWVQPLLDDVSFVWGPFFFVYVTLVVFAVIKIITALFLKDTLNVAAHDVEAMKQRALADKQHATNKLQNLLMEAGFSHTDMLSWEDFNRVLAQPLAQETMMALELDWEEVGSVFHVLDDGDGMVSFDEFLSGVLRLKGQARSSDILALLHDTKKILHKLDAFGAT